MHAYIICWGCSGGLFQEVQKGKSKKNARDSPKVRLLSRPNIILTYNASPASRWRSGRVVEDPGESWLVLDCTSALGSLRVLTRSGGKYAPARLILVVAECRETAVWVGEEDNRTAGTRCVRTVFSMFGAGGGLAVCALPPDPRTRKGLG